jgi:amino acid adenylation domain-containing protein
MTLESTLGFRLSPQQEQAWRAYAEGGRADLAVQCAVEIGAGDPGRLEAALGRVVARHEILRTRFPRPPGLTVPVQVVGEPGAGAFELAIERPARPPAHEGLPGLLALERRRAFDLADGPLVRARLFTTDGEGSLLVLTLPALVADPASARVLVEELAKEYAGAAPEGEPLQYADVAEIFHEWQHPDEPDAVYWSRHGAAPGGAAVRLGALRARPEVPAPAHETVAARLPAGPVRSCASRLGVPVSTVLLACWYGTLWHAVGRRRVEVGVLFDGRTAVEFDGALGLFARYLPLPLELDPRRDLAATALELASGLDEAAERQDAFSWSAVEPLLTRDGSGPSWPFLFDFHPEPSPAGSGFAIVAEHAAIEPSDLHLCVREGGDDLLLELHHDVARTEPEAAALLLERTRQIAGRWTAAPATPLGELDPLVEEERRLLAELNATARPLDPSATADRLVEERALAAPDSTALVWGAEHRSYGHLRRRAQRLARRLRALGVGHEARVGLFLERSPALVEGILGTLLAGAAYVPLDPSYPEERCRFLARDAGLSALLVGRGGTAPFAGGGCPIVRIDCEDPASGGDPEDAPGPGRPVGRSLPDALAYVLYTSGSTGRPKGVMVTHRSLVNYLVWAREAYRPEAGRGAPVHSPAGFDLTVTSLLVPLVAGAAVTLLPERDDAATVLPRVLRATPGFSLVKLTPAHLELLLRTLRDEELAGCARRLVIGGDALFADRLAAWRERAPDTRLVNEYGPTETVVGCAVHEVAADDPANGPVPIGRPIANTRLFMVGPEGRPVPAGVEGELWIGGAGLARGYLGHPGPTAERFVPDPFGPAGGRLYRSGDRVCFEDGCHRLVYRGRIDDQVKVRGHRVEPREIEAALEAHGAVRQAAVALRGEQLVAYLVRHPGAEVPADALRRHLAERLPLFMVPVAFVDLEALPLTPHGKLDRAALPDPHEGPAGAAYRPPRSFVEELLAEVFAGALGLERVGIDDHFFAAGGDSIRAIQVLSIVEDRGFELTLQDLFLHPTIRALAPVVGTRGEGAEEPVVPGPFELLAPGVRDRLPEGVEDAYPLSRLQVGMLFHSDLAAGSAIYHDLHSFNLRGALDLEQLAAAVDAVVRRHTALRTGFDLASFDEPLQLVERSVSSPLEVADLSALAGEEQQRTVQERLAAERHRGFDWSRGPLARFLVHVRGPEAFQFTLSFHHAILDGWSAASLLTELFRRYSRALAGERPAEEPPLAASFRHFVALERAALASEPSREFWRRHLEDAPRTRLPRRSPPGTAGGPAVGNRAVPLPPELSDALGRLARTEAVPLKSVLLAAHLRVLGLLSGRTDVSTGLVSHGRPETQDGERVLGLFLNTLPVRSRLPGGSWRELVHAAFELEKSVLPHRRFPLAELRRLAPGPPLFEAVFNFMHYHVYRGVEGFDALEVVDRISYEETDLILTAHAFVDPGSERVRVVLAYRRDQVADPDVEAFAGYYGAALSALAEAPGRRYEEAILLGETERRELLSAGGVRRESSPIEGVVAPIAGWMARTPDAVALACGDSRITYGELDARTARLARRLREEGVGPEVLVAVALERSIELVVALLAVLRAGGTYVPLDPGHPPERLRWVLSDSRAPLLLTRPGVMSGEAAGGARAVWIDELGAGAPGGPYPALAEPPLDALAYVIYTSGSTGRPKGVGISRASLARLFTACQPWFRFSPGDTWTLFHSASFDFSVWEMWGALAHGGRLVVVPLETARAAPDLRGLLARERVTVLNQTPSAFRQLMAADEEAAQAGPDGPPLRLVVFGGEKLEPAMLRRWVARHGESAPELVNMYGITETTVHVTYRPVRRPDLDAATSPLGEPIHDLGIRLTDPFGQLVPASVPGEVCVAGAGLARGYLGRPSLTAERFVPDAFTGDPGGRLYRSGDLARGIGGGDLEYLGRIDQQVKIRGFRIELGEIEAALLAHPAVREAAVLAEEAPAGGARLVAFVVARAGSAGDLPGALRSALAERLPDYMVPAAFVPLERLPLTANGKLDRARLLESAGAAREVAAAPFAAPRTPIEEMLAEIWCQVLGCARVGADDDFFEIGGHSLLATQVVSWVRRAFAVELPLRELFERPVLCDLAAEIERRRDAGAAVAPPIEPFPRDGELPLSFAQKRLWFLDQLVPGSSFYNVPASVRISGPLELRAIAAALHGVVRRHEALRTNFQAVEGRPRQTISPWRPFAVPCVDLSGLGAAERRSELARLASAEARKPFDLASDPLYRFVLVRVGPADHALLATLHHIVSDGWSNGILHRELAGLYQAAADRRPSPLPELPVQYVDFAVWQRRWLSGQVLARQLAYWKERLADPPRLELPGDRPRPRLATFRGASVRTTLPDDLRGRLSALARGRGATLYMVLLAGFETLLHRFSGQEDLLVGTPIANRNRAETEGLIGFFVNTLALRADLGGRPSFGELVERVRDVALGAYGHQDLPFERLVEALHPERDTGRNPLFQAAFVLQNFPDSLSPSPGLTVAPLPVGHANAKFDLQLFMGETRGGLQALLEYATDLFDATTARRLLDHFVSILEGAAADPELPLDELPWLSAAERHQLSREWNDTAAPMPDGRLEGLLAEQAARTPDAVAVTAEGSALSYAELERRAGALAARLRRLGCGPETRVAVAMERSLELIVALVGTLRSGAAYVPLDPDYPGERLEWMLADAGPAALVTQRRVLDALPPVAVPALCLDEAGPGDVAPAPALMDVAGGESLAYVIYTSGSTGRPKGAMVHHAALCNRLAWMQEAYRLGPGDAVLQKTPYSFDVSGWEFFWPLLTGARLVVARPGGHRDAAYLARSIQRERVTVTHFVPSMLRAFLDQPGLEACTSLWRLVASGEALPPDLVAQVSERLGVALENLYGPTEAAIDVTAWHGEPGAVPEVVPIGWPIANTSIHLADRSLRPVALGAPGELLIGGRNVGRGYLRRPGLTAERFVPDVHGPPGSRLYRTGDLARRRADGAVEFLGRLDHQVKVRGFRVELGEIEAALAEHPLVAQAVASARPGASPGDVQLVAHVVVRPESLEAGDEPDRWRGERVEAWQAVFDASYREPSEEGADPAFDLAGWVSSYDGRPLPEADMREWVDGTVERLLEEEPRSVLEIGCGTGLLLLRVAPRVARYHGTDIAAPALDRLQATVAAQSIAGVELERRPADEFSGLPRGAFDLVVLNSVAQYFPDLDYLLGVVAGALDVLAPDGSLFLGDLRSLPLLECLHASVESARAEPSTPVAELRRRVAEAIAGEEELVLDPRLFRALPARFPAVREVEVQLRAGRRDNELTRFRYDIVLRKRPRHAGRGTERVSWDGLGSLAALERRLVAAAGAPLTVSGVPNARLAAPSELVRRLRAAPAGTVAARLSALAGAPDVGARAVPPADLWALGRRLKYRAEVAWENADPALLEVSFRAPRAADAPEPALAPEGDGPAATPWRRFANRPLASRLTRSLVPRLREHLEARLPSYMVPSSVLVLEELPLTPSGKVDRKALPAPVQDRPESRAFVPPEGPTEETLAAIWREVLGLERVGAHDDFFELGGHSLLATQVVSRIRGALGVEVPLTRVFEQPTLAGLAGAVRAARSSGLETPPIEPGPRGPELPLSFAQQRLWFLHRLEPESAAYNVATAVVLEGALDPRFLRAAFEEVVSRHEVLRTTFGEVAGRPVQRVGPAGRFPLPRLDLAALPPAAGERVLLDLAQLGGRLPFDLTHGPLVRATLVHLDRRRHALLLGLHHIVSDGWSMEILIRELAALYRAAAAGLPSPLRPLPIQYADFALWQRRRLTGAVLEAQLAYWRERLATAPPVLDLPTDRARPPAPSGRGGRRSRTLASGLAERLRTLGRREGATSFMTLLTGFGALLHRYSGSEDFVVGTDVANRNREETERLIGFFVNQLALRIDAGGDPSFRGLLARVRDSAVGAYAHQDLPFERLVEELQPVRDLARQPVFQVVFALQNMPSTALDLAGLSLRRLPSGGATAQFDLTVMALETPTGIALTVEYDADLFDPATVDRLLRHYGVLLEAAVEAPARRVLDLPLLARGERHQALVEWNDTAAATPWTTPVHRLLDERAAAAPDAVAARAGEAAISYAELSHRSRDFAAALTRRGVGAEDVVPLLAERGLDLLVAVLGTLRTGAVYLPLDPRHPMLRQVDWIVRSGARAVVAARHLTEELLRGLDAAGERRSGVLVLEDLLAEPAGAAPDHPGGGLAYVIFTSGSTGLPKGAMVEHHGMANHLWAKVAGLGLTAGDAVAQTASQCFDISVWQLLAALIVGGRVEVYPDDVAHDPYLLVPRIDRDRVSILETVPSVLRMVLDEIEARGEEAPRLEALRWLIPTGEALPPSLCRRWLRRYPHAPLLNAYGPTECSDDVTHQALVAAGREADAERVPIGRPLENLRLHVLDRRLRPAPIGVPGELHVGGVGVGRGYLGDPRRTVESWRPDPFDDRPGARLYATGDLARLLPGGALEFLGRLDHQVKIRGHRIELGEVEAALRNLPEVADAAVLAREDRPGEHRLVAYVVPRSADDDADDAAKVALWRAVFDEVYERGAVSEQSAEINLRVWVSSYTGRPLPEPEIVECVEDSVARMLDLEPRRVLEIGCGTGLLLFRLAPSCEEYWGSDLSGEVLRALDGRVRERRDLPPVTLLERAADDFSGLPADGFDTVVLNEVVQYFPSVEYLLRVLEGAVGVTAPGGRIFVGGLRSLPLLETFHASVVLGSAPGEMTVEELRQGIRRRLSQEKELAVDPALFSDLVTAHPRLASAALQLKGGRASNEITRFRYDAVLTRGARAGRGEERPLDWQAEGLTLDGLAGVLADAGDGVLRVTRVPNARLVREAAAMRLVREDGIGTVAELRQALDAPPRPPAVEPDDLVGLGRRLGYRVETRWLPGGDGDLLDCRFARPGATAVGACGAVPVSLPALRSSVRRYGNRPVGGSGAADLSSHLRAVLAEQLPEAMIPSAILLLEALPLTANGKLDRRALPAPDASPRTAGAGSRNPLGRTEKAVAAAWTEVLGIDRVGADDNFFELGGHSLLATQVLSRLRAVLGIDLPLRTLFTRPTVAALAAEVEAHRGGRDGALPPIERVPRDGTLPLSFAQQRLWFLDQVLPGRPEYNVPIAVRLAGRLDLRALKAALSAVLARHEVLRTTFETLDGEPVQRIRKATAVALPLLDLSRLPAERRRPEARRLAIAEGRAPFDLGRDPMLRTRLLRLRNPRASDGGGEHVALLTLHHIASDGWSVAVLIREVGALYPAFAAGRPSPLPELRIQYGDYAAGQKEWSRSERFAETLEYWRTLLAGPPASTLPTDRPRPAVQTHRGRNFRRTLPEPLAGELRKLANRESATLFMVLLTAFATVLHQKSDATDVAVGTDVAGRDRPELEDLVGFFVNQVVLRLDLTGDPPLRELLRRVREAALGAFSNQDAPFEKVVAAVERTRDLSRSPLFQVKLVLQNLPPARIDLPDLRVSLLPSENRTAKFDLLLDVQDRGDALGVKLEYNADLFEPGTAERLVEGFEAAVRWLVSEPDARLSRVVAELEASEERRFAERRREIREGQARALRGRRGRSERRRTG